MVSLKLSSPARGALRRISKKKGWTLTLALEQALIKYDRETVTAR